MAKGLPYGANEEAQELSDMLDDEEEYTPSSPEEEFLLSASDRPAEPLTAGAPFGAGPDASRYGFTSNEGLLRSVAERALADPALDPTARTFFSRVLAEE
jgi:hypothetical protein